MLTILVLVRLASANGVGSLVLPGKVQGLLSQVLQLVQAGAALLPASGLDGDAHLPPAHASM